MYLKFNLSIDEIIQVFKGTSKDLLALQLQAIKDTGLANKFEKDFSSCTLEEIEIEFFSINIIPHWLAINGYHKTRELIIKRIKAELDQTLID